MLVVGGGGCISVPSDIHSAPEGDTRLSQEAFMAHLTLDSLAPATASVDWLLQPPITSWLCLSTNGNGFLAPPPSPGWIQACTERPWHYPASYRKHQGHSKKTMLLPVSWQQGALRAGSWFVLSSKEPAKKSLAQTLPLFLG